MALTYTPPSNAKKTLPVFSLPAVDGNTYTIDTFKEKVLVIMFICNHCPYVQCLEDRILKLIKFFKNKSVRFVGICSNDSKTYPEDSFSNLKKTWKKKNYGFIYLHDEMQAVAKKLQAVCTPDFFIYNQKRRQAWRGRFDDSVEDEDNVKTEEMKQAIQSVLKNKKPPIEKPSCGCSIKWS